MTIGGARCQKYVPPNAGARSHCRSNELNTEFSMIVVGYDGSEQAEAAVHRAIQEAELRGTELHVVYVADYTPATLHLPGDATVSTADLAEAQRQEIWKSAAPLLASKSGVETVDLTGYPPQALVDYSIEVGADLLVMGRRGRRRLASTFLGSTSRHALEHARCDVLIVKSP